MIGLTPRQNDVLRFLRKHHGVHGVYPTFSEIKDALGFASNSRVHRLLSDLEERGVIRRLKYKERAIEMGSTADAVLFLPPPPSVNQLYFNRTGGRGKTKRKRDFGKRVAEQVMLQKPPRFKGAYSLEICLRRNGRSGDLANYEKAISDALVDTGVLEDDKHLKDLRLYWGDPGRADFPCRVRIEGTTA